jgi:hypothetical protein
MGPDDLIIGSSTSGNVSTENGTIKKVDPVASGISKLREPLDDTNWTIWRDRISRVFAYCGVDCYVKGTLKRPDPVLADPSTVAIWDANDIYAQILITNNISKEQMVHVPRLGTSCEIWNSLTAIHETKDYRIAIHIQRSLFRQSVMDDGDIIEHLAQLKRQWERLNVLDDREFHIADKQFKTIIASSLPETWDTFTEPYVGGRMGTVETDPKKLMSSQEFIGTIKEEYLRRRSRDGTTPQANYVNSGPAAHAGHAKKNARPLAKRIQDAPASSSTSMHCNNCQQSTHITDNCKWLGQPRCTKCTWFGHIAPDCRRGQKRKGENGGERQGKKPRPQRTYAAVEGSESNAELTELVFMADACIHTSEPLNEGDNINALNHYDWLADTATTSHITNKRENFTTFYPIEKPVNGVGNAQTNAKGKGTVRIKTITNGRERTLTLADVLYIPTNPHNLLSLGRW